MDKDKFMFVYDKELSSRLIKSGEKPITSARALSSLKRFSLFYKSDNVIRIADEYLMEKRGEL